MPVSWMVLVAAMWLLVILMAVILLGLLRRVVTLESLLKSGGGATQRIDPMSAVPPVGATLPLSDTLLAPASERGNTAVLFLGSGCQPCRSLAKELAASLADPSVEPVVADGDELVVVTDPAGADMFAGIGRLLIDENRELRRALGVVATPMAFGVDQAGVVCAADFVPDVDYVRELLASCDRRAAAATAGPPIISVWHSAEIGGNRAADRR